MTPLEALACGQPLPAEQLEALAEEYPYFASPLLRRLSLPVTAGERRELRMRVAAIVGSRDTLAALFGEEPEEFAAFYPDERKPELSTEDTIESFLDRFGDNLESQAETGGLVPVAPPQIDYAATMLADSQPASYAADDQTSSMLDSFLGAPGSVSADPEPQQPAESAALTESFARIMIKNHNYRKALEIIEALNLNNPEKSVYFADQIRFLRKLILIESKKTSK